LLDYGHPFLNLQMFAENPKRLSAWYALYQKLRLPLLSAIEADRQLTSDDYVFFAHARLVERLTGDYPRSYFCDAETADRIADYAAEQVDDESKDDVRNKIKNNIQKDARARYILCLEQWLPKIGLNLSPDEMNWIAGKIVKTRNHFAHHNDDVKPRQMIPPGGYGVFTDLLRTLIDFEIATRIGIEESVVADRLKGTYQVRNAQQVTVIRQDES